MTMIIRIYGDELDESDVYIDAEVGAYDLSGEVQLIEVGDGKGNKRSWKIPANNLHDLDRKDLIIDHEDLDPDNQDAWDAVSHVNGQANKNANKNAKGDLKKISEDLFKTIAHGRKV